jgi:hypothetical protein
MTLDACSTFVELEYSWPVKSADVETLDIGPGAGGDCGETV